MSILHSQTLTVADATGPVVYGAFPMTSTINATDINRPSDWNAGHIQALTLTGNTAGVSTISGTNIVFSGGNNVSLSAVQGLSVATLNFSAGADTVDQISIAAGTSSAVLGSLVFSSSGNISFGLNGSTITANAFIRTFAGTTNFALSVASFANSNGVSFGISTTGGNAAVITASVATSLTAVNFSAGTTSNNLSAVTFSNSNGVSFGLNGSVVTGSVSGIGVGVSTGGNTAGSTGTVSTGNYVFVGSNGITLSQSTGAAGSAGTLSIVGEPIVSMARPSGIIIGGVLQQDNSTVSVVPMLMSALLSASNLRLAASIDVASVANASSAYLDISASAVIYTRNGSTLSSLASGSNTMTVSWSSNVTASVVGVKELTLDIGGTNLFSRGEYWMAVHISTTNTATGGANTTALGNSISMVLAPYDNESGVAARAMALAAPLGSAANATYGMIPGAGLFASNATRGSIAFSTISATSANALAAELYWNLRNYKIFG